jgi:hypothetical protein
VENEAVTSGKKMQKAMEQSQILPFVDVCDELQVLLPRRLQQLNKNLKGRTEW